MSKFLGIPYNKWHGIIPLLVIPAVMIILKIVLDESQIVIPYFLVLISLLTLLQAGNEILQQIDPKVEEKYGSLENFHINSKEDWKWFILGSFAGSVIGWLLWLVV